MEPKISFLIPAHNEEKIITNALDNILTLPYNNYEVLIGLDGCTDKTEEIVKSFTKKSKKFKYFKLKSRSGKPEVIDTLVNKSTGEILIIHDADWIFSVKTKPSLNKFFSVFQESSIGGIADNFPVELNKNLANSNFGYKMVAYAHSYWIKFQKTKFTKEYNKHILQISHPAMFLTNVFRKSLYQKNFSLADDFERTRNIFKRGYKIVLFKDKEMPRLVASYNRITLKDFFRQKVRTAIARKQISSSEFNYSKYNLQTILFMLSNSFLDSPLKGVYVFIWVFLTTLATIVSKFKHLDTKQGWNLRAKR